MDSKEIKKWPGFNDSIQPVRYFASPDGYDWMVHTPDQIGTTLVSLGDRTTGVVVSTILTNPEQRTADLKAFSAIRHSRDSGTVLEILKDIHDQDLNPDKRLEKIFRGGHSAIAGLAGGMIVHMHGEPMYAPMMQFNTVRRHDGQENSTRYIAGFEGAKLHDIRPFFIDLPIEDKDNIANECEGLRQKALGFYGKHKEALTPIFEKYYRPEGKDEKKSLDSRVLDVTRGFLLFGMETSHAFEGSAREWAQMIAGLRSSHIASFNQLGNQLYQLLVPSAEIEGYLAFKAEAPGLIRHAEASVLTNENLMALKNYVTTNTNLLEKVPINRKPKGEVRQIVTLIGGEYTPGDKMVAQNLLTIYPGLEWAPLLEWTHNQTDKTKAEISQINFKGYSQYAELTNTAGATDTTLAMQSQLKVDRDLNRHRPWETFINLPLMHGGEWSYDTAMQILSTGFGISINLARVPEFAQEAEAYSKDMQELHTEIISFVTRIHEKYGDAVDYTFVSSLLPLDHMVGIIMSGNVRQANYLDHQRAGNGGDFDYRDLAYCSSCQLAFSDPYLSAMKLDHRPNPENRHEFFDRS